MRSIAFLMMVVVVVGYGGVGVPVADSSDTSAGGAPSPELAESSLSVDDRMDDTDRSYPLESFVDMSLSWDEKPRDVDEEGSLRVTARARRTVTDETLFVSVPDGLDLQSGQREYDLTLERGETLTFTLTVGVADEGLHRLHIYSSNLVPEEQGILRASGMTTVTTPEVRERLRSPDERAVSAERPASAERADRSSNGPRAQSGPVADDSLDATDSITIDGYFGFERDNDPHGSGLEGSWGARVEIWEVDPLGDQLLETVRVDSNGGFDAQVPVQSGELDGEMELYVKVYSENDDVARAEDRDHDVHFWRWPGSGSVSKASGETWSPSFKATSGEGWLHILRNLMEGATFLEEQVGYDVPRERVEWNPTTSHGSHHHLGGKKKIHMAGNDGWDDDVILHEYGHHVMDERYSYTPGDPQSHNMWANTDLDTAWVEGWPTYFEASVQNDPDYEDINGGTTAFDWSVESGGQCGGITCEGAVIKALWDFEDTPEDSRFRTPHDVRVQLDDLRTGSFEDIWNTMTLASRSEMIGNGGVYIDTIVEFRENWYSSSVERKDRAVTLEVFALNRLPENSTVSWNGDPTADFWINTLEPHTGDLVFFDGTRSSDPENFVQWPGEWDFDGDGIAESDSGNNRFPTYNYSTYGEYQVTLTIHDNVGAVSSKTRTIEVAPAPVCSTCEVPQDPDDDGVYEDVDGNGVVDFTDVVLLYQEQNGGDASLAYDFDENGIVDFTDVVLLYQEQD